MLENGAAQLKAAGFTDVAWYNRPDALEITEVEPLIAYIQSSNTLMDHSWTEIELMPWALKWRRASRREGAFHIGKVAGCLWRTLDSRF